MIATAGGHGYRKYQSGLIAIVLDTTDTATNSNSSLPVLPQLSISGQCSGSLPAAAADDDDGWLYRRTPSLRRGLHAPPSVRRCAVHVQCELWKRLLVDYCSMPPKHNQTTFDIFLTGWERRDDSMTKTTMTSQSHVKFGPRCCTPPPVNFWQFSHWPGLHSLHVHNSFKHFKMFLRYIRKIIRGALLLQSEILRKYFFLVFLLVSNSSS